MVFPGTLLRVADNSGARVVRCLRVVGRPSAAVGDLLVVSVRRSRTGRRLPKGKVYRALLVQNRRPFSHPFGYRSGFRSSRVVLLRRSESKRGELVPLGTRLTHTVSLHLRRRGFLKLLLLAPAYL